jgi:AcrR family transcriptional regulator
LLDATVESLIERGFGGTTTTEIAHRAGVSLGAMLHHYPTKADLLTAAVGHVLERRQAEFRKEMADLEMGRDRLDAAIDLLWSAFSGPTFVAYAELWVAARTDPDLAVSVAAMGDQFTASSQELFGELFPPEEYPDAGFLAEGMGFAFAVMDGVALRGLVQPVDTSPIEILKGVARDLVDRRPADPDENP